MNVDTTIVRMPNSVRSKGTTSENQDVQEIKHIAPLYVVLVVTVRRVKTAIRLLEPHRSIRWADTPCCDALLAQTRGDTDDQKENSNKDVSCEKPDNDWAVSLSQRNEPGIVAGRVVYQCCLCTPAAGSEVLRRRVGGVGRVIVARHGEESWQLGDRGRARARLEVGSTGSEEVRPSIGLVGEREELDKATIVGGRGVCPVSEVKSTSEVILIRVRLEHRRRQV